MAREFVMPLIGQPVNLGKTTARYMSDVEDARYSQKAQVVPYD
jgi:hypothetical protein